MKKDATRPIGVDDIHIEIGECPAPSQKFRCGNGEYVDHNKVCDMAEDCSNGVDEISCGSCDFDKIGII